MGWIVTLPLLMSSWFSFPTSTNLPTPPTASLEVPVTSWSTSNSPQQPQTAAEIDASPDVLHAFRLLQLAQTILQPHRARVIAIDALGRQLSIDYSPTPQTATSPLSQTPGPLVLVESDLAP